MKIAIIGPGIMPVPPAEGCGWGAVEILIWNYYVELTKLGHKVEIINNPNLEEVCRYLNSNEFDLIHCQYDNHVGYLTAHLNKPFISTSHYGFLCQKNLWDGGYHYIFDSMLRSPGILALSQPIRDVYANSGYSGWLRHLRNGAEPDKFVGRPKGNGRAICLGKIEPRKCQVPLSTICRGKVPIDYVGPVVDYRFKPSGDQKYLGSWSKEQVYNNLSEYSCLVLPSMGEAAALVIPEALMCGLSVVVSEESAANLPNHPFIKVIPSFTKPQEFTEVPIKISQMIDHNNGFRSNIVDFARNYFGWDVIIKEYLEIVEEFKQ